MLPFAGPVSSSEGEKYARPGSRCEHDWVPEGPVFEGRVSAVTGGDTITVELSSGPIKVRMHSIDAPERDQPGGREARAALEQRLRAADVALEPIEQDRFDRMVAVVYLGDANLNAWLVCEGHAWVYREYARDPRYCEAEIAARSERRGVWARPAAEPRAPWEWRAVKRHRRDGYSDYAGETLEHCVAALGRRPAPGYRRSPEGHAVETSLAARSRLSVPRNGPAKDPRHPHDATAPQTLLTPPSTADTMQAGCRIKGNISRSGNIYYVAGSRAYDKTVIDESKGERWFCSEAEAEAAGWRAPRG
jgi:endonuclease YncB( thermonuclease family)